MGCSFHRGRKMCGRVGNVRALPPPSGAPAGRCDVARARQQCQRPQGRMRISGPTHLHHTYDEGTGDERAPGGGHSVSRRARFHAERARGWVDGGTRPPSRSASCGLCGSGRWGCRSKGNACGGGATFSFGPSYGVTVAYVNRGHESLDGLIAIPEGAFAEVDLPVPGVSVWEERKCAWVEVTGEVEHIK